MLWQERVDDWIREQVTNGRAVDPDELAAQAMDRFQLAPEDRGQVEAIIQDTLFNDADEVAWSIYLYPDSLSSGQPTLN